MSTSSCFSESTLSTSLRAISGSESKGGTQQIGEQITPPTQSDSSMA